MRSSFANQHSLPPAPEGKSDEFPDTHHLVLYAAPNLQSTVQVSKWCPASAVLH